MKEAAFSLKDIIFEKVSLDTSLSPQKGRLDVDFDTSGVFDKKQNKYFLTLKFFAFDSKNNKEENSQYFVFTEVLATFDFEKKVNLDSIPEYFYSNSIAMVYPYIRSFVTSLIFQANIKKPFLLPTLNLMSLGILLEENTSIK